MSFVRQSNTTLLFAIYTGSLSDLSGQRRTVPGGVLVAPNLVHPARGFASSRPALACFGHALHTLPIQITGH